MVDDREAFLALRSSGEGKARYYRKDEASELRFRFVDFNQNREIILSVAEIKSVSDVQFFYGKAVPAEATQNEYLDLLEETIAEIQKKELGKIVISRARVLDKRVEPMRLFHLLDENYPNATVYLFSHPEAGTWLGATPETLLEKEEEVLKTMSLAGTISANEQEQFSHKEEQEQQMVTDFIFDCFSETPSLSEISLASRRESQSGKLLHLETPIQARADANFDIDNLLKMLHPTPAVSGLPRDAALRWIDEKENYQRSFYAGYFGFEDKVQAHFWVNLRCVQLFEYKVALYAGGGITAGSNAKSEWQETEAKMRTIADVLQDL